MRSWNYRLVFSAFVVGQLLAASCCSLLDTGGGDAGEGSAPADGGTAADSSELATLIGAGKMAAITAANGRLAKVSSATQFAAVYRELIALTDSVQPDLQTAYEAGNEAGLSQELFAAFPVYGLDYGAEGTAVLVTMNYPPLQARAAATPEPADEAYLTMLSKLYADACGTGWSNLEIRTWEYGGCSPLGSGLHKDILLAADTARGHGDLFVTEIEEARKFVLQDILEDDTEFEYCDASTGPATPTPKAKLRAEVQGILDEVQLSDDERKAVEQRLRARFSAPAPAAKPATKPTPAPEDTEKKERRGPGPKFGR